MPFREKDAVSINETQTMAGYHVTLLGLVSGKDITQFERKSNGEILYDRTYCVTAIKKRMEHRCRILHRMRMQI